jgi:glycine/D-amino acid oxidase-like deaminating enzyme
MDYESIIIGAGFYGISVATHLCSLGAKRVLVIEREDAPMRRASLINQARVHNGYHYPRNFVTAYRSAQSFSRFVKEYRNAVKSDFDQIYAIAARGSHVSARQFSSVMRSIGVLCEGAQRSHFALFNPSTVEAVFRTVEYAFDAKELARISMDKAEAAGVEFLWNTEVQSLDEDEKGCVKVFLGNGDVISAPTAFNCTYGRIHKLHPGIKKTIKYEACEVCLIEPPNLLKNLGITVMDGPFWSCMPYPARNLHSLTHVKHTPGNWITSDNAGEQDPYFILPDPQSPSAFEAMRADAARFVPCMQEAKFVDSLREVKSILIANEGDDGRPILVDGKINSGITSVLGGKLDNIFDVLDRITEAWKGHK